MKLIIQPDTSEEWQEYFAPERLRLLAALGEMTTGGIVENIQHIGATSVPGVAAQPTIDIALAVAPFPLEPLAIATLEALGYTPVAGDEGAPGQRFRHATAILQLYVAEAGSTEWVNYLLLRDYLRQHEAARQAYSAAKQAWAACADANADEYEQAKAQHLAALLPAAHAWWVDQQGFAPVTAVVEELKGFTQPWYISSGWALDLFLAG